MQFFTKIDGFEQKDSQGFENSYNSYEQYPLEKFFIFTIYQNYTLALRTLLVQNTFIYTGPKFWNSLDSYIKDAPSLNSFKSELKMFLLKGKFSSGTEGALASKFNYDFE